MPFQRNCPKLNYLNLKTFSLSQSASCPTTDTTEDCPIGNQPVGLDKDIVLQPENTLLIHSKDTNQCTGKCDQDRIID